MTGDERLRLAAGDLFQAHLLADDVAERDSDAVRDHNDRAGFPHELRNRGINALLPWCAQSAEALRFFINVVAEKKCQEERRGDLVPLLNAGIRDRKVDTSMISSWKWKCARRNRRPTRRQLRNIRFTSPGVALVTTSKSFGSRPSRRSRTQSRRRDSRQSRCLSGGRGCAGHSGS